MFAQRMILQLACARGRRKDLVHFRPGNQVYDCQGCSERL